MEIRYRWERNETYMLIDAGQTALAHYQVKMLESNHIHGLLKVRMRQMNQSSEFSYTISGRQTMMQKFGNSCISVDQIRQLMAALNQTAGELETYLLDMDNLLLDPSFIFWREDDLPPEFCYYPEETPEKPFRENLRGLFQYLLNKADHEDTLSVTVVYGLYQISVKETFRMQDCMQFLFYEAEEAPGRPKSRAADCGAVRETWEPDGMPARQKIATRGKAAAKRQAAEQQETAESGMPSVSPRPFVKGNEKRQIWLDRVLILVIAALAAAAIWKVLSGRYGWQANAGKGGWIPGVLLVGFVVLISAAVIGRLCRGHRKADDPGNADPARKEEMRPGASLPDRNRRDPVRIDDDWPEEIWSDPPIPSAAASETCVLGAGAAQQPAGGCFGPAGAAAGFWFRYQGEKKVNDFFLDGESRQAFVGKDLTQPDIGLHWSTVSRRHAQLTIRNGICTIQDCGSTNGTYLDGVRLHAGQSKILLPGAEVKFADLIFRMEPAGQGEDGTQVLRCGDDFGKIV